MRAVVIGLVVVLVAVPGVSGTVATAEPPLADAGLDRQTEVGRTVQLDATGSQDPDGRIEHYEWRIETPDGTTVSPACETCGRTSFVPVRRGQYNATVIVTDDDGITRSDTLYVTVERGPGPDITISGPQRPRVGSTVTYTALLTGNGVPLDSVEWNKNSTDLTTQTVSGTSVTVTQNSSFSETVPKDMTVTVTDVAGQTANETFRVTPQSNASGGGDNSGGDGDDNGGNGDDDNSNDDGDSTGDDPDSDRNADPAVNTGPCTTCEGNAGGPYYDPQNDRYIDTGQDQTYDDAVALVDNDPESRASNTVPVDASPHQDDSDSGSGEDTYDDSDSNGGFDSDESDSDPNPSYDQNNGFNVDIDLGLGF